MKRQARRTWISIVVVFLACLSGAPAQGAESALPDVRIGNCGDTILNSPLWSTGYDPWDRLKAWLDWRELWFLESLTTSPNVGIGDNRPFSRRTITAPI